MNKFRWKAMDPREYAYREALNKLIPWKKKKKPKYSKADHAIEALEKPVCIPYDASESCYALQFYTCPALTKNQLVEILEKGLDESKKIKHFAICEPNTINLNETKPKFAK